MKYNILKEIPVELADFLTKLDFSLLKESEDAGYKAIAVSVYDPKVKETEYWGKPHEYSRNDIEFLCGEPDPRSKNKGMYGDSHGVWKIVSKLGGGTGCGNTRQYQLINDHKYTKISYHLRRGKWYAQNWIEYISKSTLKDLKKMTRTTEDHINNVETIRRQMKQIRILIEKHGENEAFENLMEKVEGWNEYIRLAKDHVGLATAHVMPNDIFQPEKLDSLVRILTNKKNGDKFGI